jgi:hypothetical protein
VGSCVVTVATSGVPCMDVVEEFSIGRISSFLLGELDLAFGIGGFCGCIKERWVIAMSSFWECWVIRYAVKAVRDGADGLRTISPYLNNREESAGRFQDVAQSAARLFSSSFVFVSHRRNKRDIRHLAALNLAVLAHVVTTAGDRVMDSRDECWGVYTKHRNNFFWVCDNHD